MAEGYSDRAKPYNGYFFRVLTAQGASAPKGARSYIVNKAMIGAHRLGLSMGDKGPVVLTVPGRKSGKPHSTPVTPITVDDKRYVVGGLPGADWVANARATGEVTLRRGRHTERVRLVELRLNEARPLLRLWPTEVPQSVGFGKNAGLVTGPNPDEFEALAGRCPVFRLDPVNA